MTQRVRGSVRRNHLRGLSRVTTVKHDPWNVAINGIDHDQVEHVTGHKPSGDEKTKCPIACGLKSKIPEHLGHLGVISFLLILSDSRRLTGSKKSTTSMRHSITFAALVKRYT